MPTGKCHHKDGGMKGARQTMQFVPDTSGRIDDSIPIKKRDEVGLNQKRHVPMACGKAILSTNNAFACPLHFCHCVCRSIPAAPQSCDECALSHMKIAG
jgi:hypothetical protein